MVMESIKIECEPTDFSVGEPLQDPSARVGFAGCQVYLYSFANDKLSLEVVDCRIGSVRVARGEKDDDAGTLLLDKDVDHWPSFCIDVLW